MDFIRQNPFRVLGLNGNATERELQKQIGIIKRYAEIGKMKSFDYDFECLGTLFRSSENIQLASNRIEQAHKKIFYALFWFVKNNQFDEIALNNLKNNQKNKAAGIWSKTLKKEITGKNFSSYLNLSTLCLAFSAVGEQLYKKDLKTGISLKGDLIYSNYFKDFSVLVTGNKIASDPIEISKQFVDEIIEFLKPYLNKKKGISINDLLDLFSTFPNSIQKYISTKFTDTPVSNIENKIDQAATKRKEDPGNADKFGKVIFKSTKRDMILLGELLGESNLQYQMIANKLANEILQCSIDFFNKHRGENGEFDPGHDAIKIVRYADLIGATGHIKDKINETLTSIQEWINDAPNRKKQKIVADDLAFVMAQLQTYQTLPHTIENSDNLIVSCEPKLIEIQKKLGSNDDLYLQVSSAVVTYALGMIIEVVNTLQLSLQNNPASFLIEFPGTISFAVSVLKKLEYFDMTDEVRGRYSSNTNTIVDIASQLKTLPGYIHSSSSSSSGTLLSHKHGKQTNKGQSYSSQVSSKSSSDECYIATMVYGDYNHPQVIVLRTFRDEKLLNTMPGKSFVNFYYKVSPYFVKICKNQKYINQLIKKLLDILIERVK